MMDAISASIFQRQASKSSKKRVAVELIYLQGYFNDLIKLLLPYPRPTPLEEVTCVRLGLSIDAMPQEGQTAPPWW